MAKIKEERPSSFVNDGMRCGTMPPIHPAQRHSTRTSLYIIQAIHHITPVVQDQSSPRANGQSSLYHRVTVSIHHLDRSLCCCWCWSCSSLARMLRVCFVLLVCGVETLRMKRCPPSLLLWRWVCGGAC